MTSPSIALAATVALMAACTHRRRVSLLPRDFLGKTVEVRLRDGRSTKAHAERTPHGIVWRIERPRHDEPQFTSSTTRWKTGPQDRADSRERRPDLERIVVSWRDLREVTEVSHGRGAVEGLAVGAGIGLSIGILAVLLYDSGPPPREDGGGVPTELAAVAVGSAGALLGLLIGAAIGSRLVYELDEPDGTDVSAGGPPGSVVGASVTF